MRYSNATCYYYEFSAEEAISHFAKSGWDCIELSTEHSQELISRGNNYGAVGTELIRHAKSEGVDIPQAHLALRIDIADNENFAVTDELKRWLEMYLAIGVKSAVLHPGGHVVCKRLPGISMQELTERRLEALRILTDFIKGSPLSICLENVGYMGSCEEINGLIDQIGDSNLGICLDTGHLNLSYHHADAFLPIYRQGHFIRTAGKRLKAMHVHDNDGTSDQHIMPYTYGNVDFKEVMDALREINYSHLFNLEIPSEARDIRIDKVYPLSMRYAKSKYLQELYGVLKAL